MDIRFNSFLHYIACTLLLLLRNGSASTSRMHLAGSFLKASPTALQVSRSASCKIKFLAQRSIAPHQRVNHGTARYATARYATSTHSSSAPGPVDMVKIKTLLRTAQAVCFDVDSTVIPEEGIDQLAEFQGAGAAVAEWTAKAMGGQVLFEDALAARLELIKPSKQQLQQFLDENPPKLSSGVKEVIDELHRRGAVVYLVSGGFRQMIEPVAELLHIPFHRIYANNLLFDNETGDFAGFDDAEPTSRDGGKPAVMKQLTAAHGYHPLIMVGDGATDMQARPPADLFIGYGGVVVREAVQQGADWFITDFHDVLEILKADD